MSQGLTFLSGESTTKIPMHFRKNRWETPLGKWELSHFRFGFTFCPLLKILASEKKAFFDDLEYQNVLTFTALLTI